MYKEHATSASRAAPTVEGILMTQGNKPGEFSMFLPRDLQSVKANFDARL
jgi:hypothetical protein